MVFPCVEAKGMFPGEVLVSASRRHAGEVARGLRSEFYGCPGEAAPGRWRSMEHFPGKFIFSSFFEG